MAGEFTLSVVAPDRSVVETLAVTAVLPGSEGYFGIQKGHVPLVAALRPGLLEYSEPNGSRHTITIGGGFVEVRADKITVLADDAQLDTEIDLARAEADLEDARRALRGESSGMTNEEATKKLEQSMLRVKAARQLR